MRLAGNRPSSTQQEEQCEFRVELQRVMYPKGAKKVSDSFGIVTAKVVEIIKGTPKLHPQYDTITIKGYIPDMEKNRVYNIVAKEEFDSKYKSYTYNLSHMYDTCTLDTEQDQRAFLGYVLTEQQVDSFFETFDNPLEVIKEGNIDKLCKVKGVGQVKAKRIIENYQKVKNNAKAYVELAQYGLTKKMIDKLVERYENVDVAIAKVKKNVYILANEVDGIGFSKADQFALNGGMSPDCVERGMAIINHILYTNAQMGNSYMYTEDVVDKVYEQLGAYYPEESISQALKNLVKMNILWHNTDKSLIALKRYYNLEKSIAQHLIRLRDAQNTFHYEGWEQKIRNIEQNQGWEFTSEQWASIQATLEHNVVLITGSAGTGKSTSVLGMLRALDSDAEDFAQTALSGRASVNLTDVTGYEGYTIHRLLEYGGSSDDNKFKRNSENPLSQRIIILDELSMVDANLFDKLLDAMATGSKLVMLGDDGQLESIGVGNIIYDLIECGAIKHCHLTKIHRQASKSAIITESRKIRESMSIVSSKFEGTEVRGELQDLNLIGYHDNPYRDKDELKPTIDLMVEKYKEKLKLVDNMSEICAILPTKSRGSSCYKLNKILQSIVLPIGMLRGLDVMANSKEPYTLYKGDKVINLVNDRNAVYIDEDNKEHSRQIFNGNMGIIESINHENSSIVVNFENIGLVTIKQEKLSNIALGYCVTCHKLQGSSAKYVICGLDNSHYTMQTRELVYTMLTRAKKHCDFVFETKALVRAIRTTNIVHKNTFLAHFLNGNLSCE